MKHGHRQGKKGLRTPTYNSWRAMKHRCLNKNAWNYDRYGGMGVQIQESWLRFEGFLADMGERPEGKTLDRIDPEGYYCKENCQWAGIEWQNKNKRKNEY